MNIQIQRQTIWNMYCLLRLATKNAYASYRQGEIEVSVWLEVRKQKSFWAEKLNEFNRNNPATIDPPSRPVTNHDEEEDYEQPDCPVIEGMLPLEAWSAFESSKPGEEQDRLLNILNQFHDQIGFEI